MRTMYSTGKKFCVFCKHWYDPANAALEPLFPAGRRWNVDETAENMCMYYSKQRKALNTCAHFESKI
jgi:hypothetical protein